MSLDVRCLDAFPQWLRSLGEDARALAAIVDGSASDATRREIAGALNYLFKSLDLIPDGIEDLGYIDDAFVLRVAAARVASADAASTASDATLRRLAEDARLVQEFLGDLYARLDAWVSKLGSIVARGRSVDDVLINPSTRAELVSEVSAWAQSYVPPSFTRDEKNLVKLRAFLAAKLPG
jgi:uncharacterized membrane protein YkvA (DUF1232 family)